MRTDSQDLHPEPPSAKYRGSGGGGQIPPAEPPDPLKDSRPKVRGSLFLSNFQFIKICVLLHVVEI